MNILRNIIFYKYSIIPIILILITNSCKLFCPENDDDEQQVTQRIAFLRDSDSTIGKDIWIMDMDGSNQTQLTFDISDITSFTFSPDGEKICFKRTYDYNNSDIYIVNADGSDLKNLTNDDIFHRLPFFASDGEKLVFNSELPQLDIFTMNIDGSNRTNITNTDSLTESVRSIIPNSNQILISVYPVPNYDPPQELYLIDIDGSNKTCITCQYEELEPRKPQITSDGKQVLFLSWGLLWVDSYFVLPLYLIDIATSNLELIYQFDVLDNIYDIQLAPGDEYILYRIDADYYRINIDGTDNNQLTQDYVDSFSADISFNGKYITFTECLGGSCGIYIMDSDGNNQKFITEGVRSKFQPLFE